MLLSTLFKCLQISAFSTLFSLPLKIKSHYGQGEGIILWPPMHWRASVKLCADVDGHSAQIA